MDSLHLGQLTQLVNELGEHLRLLQESRDDLLKATRETDEIARELQLLIDDAQKFISKHSHQKSRTQ